MSEGLIQGPYTWRL